MLPLLVATWAPPATLRAPLVTVTVRLPLVPALALTVPLSADWLTDREPLPADSAMPWEPLSTPVLPETVSPLAPATDSAPPWAAKVPLLDSAGVLICMLPVLATVCPCARLTVPLSAVRFTLPLLTWKVLPRLNWRLPPWAVKLMEPPGTSVWKTPPEETWSDWVPVTLKLPPVVSTRPLLAITMVLSEMLPVATSDPEPVIAIWQVPQVGSVFRLSVPFIAWTALTEIDDLLPAASVTPEVAAFMAPVPDRDRPPGPVTLMAPRSAVMVPLF